MEQEVETIQHFIRETEERLALKLKQREQNAKENITYPDESVFVTLDSSIKKNSTFVRKIKNMTESQRDQLIKDINNLNLTKFISEIASSIVEAKLKLSDVPTVIDICSRLHQRYPQFSKQLLNQWIKYFPSVKKQTTHDSNNTSNIPLQSTSGCMLYMSTSTSPINNSSASNHNSFNSAVASTGSSCNQPSDTIFNPSKMRIDLRLFAELISSGIFNPKDSLNVLGNLLTYLTIHDKNSYQNASAILSFCRSCGDDYAGLVSSKMRLLAEKHGCNIPRSDFLPAEKQRALRSCLKEYYNIFCNHTINLHEELNQLDLQNKRVITTKGELSRERKERFEAKQIECQKSYNIVLQLSDILDESLPSLPVLDSCKDDANEEDPASTELFHTGSDPNLLSIWEDDDARNFYENLLDLKLIFPHLVNKISSSSFKETGSSKDATYKDEKNQKESQSVQTTTDLHSPENNGQIEVNMDTVEERKQLSSPNDTQKICGKSSNDLNEETASDSNEDDDTKSEPGDRSPIDSETLDRFEEEDQTLMDYADEETNDIHMKPTINVSGDAIENSTVSSDTANAACAQYLISSSDQKGRMTSESYFSKLANCVNRDMIDKAAVDFVRYFNTKFGRKKLVKTLFSVQRTRLDLLPFYSRLIATIHPVVSSMASELVVMLKQDFRMLFRKKDQINIESKVKNVRFIGELVKFGLFSKQEALTCLKILLSDFTHHHIEMCCNLLETCGRLLYRSQESHYKIKLLLEQMMRKKLLLSVDSKYITMIENAYYFSKPPEVVAQNVEIPPMQAYIKYLLYDCLSRSTIDKVLTQLRKLDWQDPEIAKFAIKCLIEVYNVKFYNIRYVAALLAAFNRYNNWVSTLVIDGVVEDILLMMEINQANYNQRRIPMIRFLGELYNYKLSESSLIFKILYSLITYGIYYPQPGSSLLQIQLSELDPPDNLFRIKLICDLLESCGQYLSSGQEKRKLDCYLLFFQRYFWCKRYIYTLHPYCMAMSDNQFPVSTEYLFKDTITTIRPKFNFATSYAQADKHVQSLIDEMTIIQKADGATVGNLSSSTTTSNMIFTTITSIASNQN